MIESACLTDRDRHAKTEKERERGRKRKREGITMSILPLGKTIMTDKMRLLKRTQWSLIDSLGREENELH